MDLLTRYHVHIPLPQEMVNRTLKLHPQPQVQPKGYVDAYLTIEEFRLAMGNAANINDFMVRNTTDDNGFTVMITLSNMSENESQSSQQMALAAAMLQEETGSTFQDEILTPLARKTKDLSPKAAHLLLETAEGAKQPRQTDMMKFARLAKERGLSSLDYLTAKPDPASGNPLE